MVNVKVRAVIKVSVNVSIKFMLSYEARVRVMLMSHCYGKGRLLNMVLVHFFHNRLFASVRGITYLSFQASAACSASPYVSFMVSSSFLATLCLHAVLNLPWLLFPCWVQCSATIGILSGGILRICPSHLSRLFCTVLLIGSEFVITC